MLKGTDITPTGTIYVCGACGKRARSKFGFDDDGNDTTDEDWDESCMINATLIYDSPTLPHRPVTDEELKALLDGEPPR